MTNDRQAIPPADVQRAAPAGWPAPPPPLGARPLPDLQPLDGRDGSRVPPRRRSIGRRLFGFLLRFLLLFVILSVLWVTAYRFIAPPVTFTMIGDMLGGHSISQRWMPISRIDRDMVRAAIGAEDSSFCQHYGFDLESIAAAAARNAQGSSVLRGGSTISQQTAKNVFLWQGGGYFRKGLEAWFTVLIEAIWGKKRIMEVYLNVAETGIGTYGVNAGALRYFRRDASNLTPLQAARIAAVLPQPKKRAGVAPKGFTRRYGSSIRTRISAVASDRLDACTR